MKTRAFTELQSHYLFAEKFGRPGKGNDKGKVEGLVGYARRNFMVPVPRFASLGGVQRASAGSAARNGVSAKLRGHQQTIGERFEKDRERLLPLAGGAVRSLRQALHAGDVDVAGALSRQRLLGAGEWGHREVLVKGFVHEVVICVGERGDRAPSAEL